jgi:tetratricopeptide (TPR) repeat protein
MIELSCMLYLTEGYFLAGQYETGRQTAQTLLDLSTRCKAKPWQGGGYRFLGEISLKTDPDNALFYFEQAMSIYNEIKAENELALAYSGMGRYHKRQGDTAQAKEYLTKALEIFERLGTLIEPDKVRKELAELAG